MREKYTRIFEGTSDLYAEGAPVIIKANVLLKDNTDGRVIAQLKYQNVSEKTVTFIKVVITPFDSMRSAIGQGETFEYLDLSAGQYEEFGSKNPLVLRERNARSYSVRVVGAAFADGCIWNDEGKEWRQDTEKAKDIDNDIVYLWAKSIFESASTENEFNTAAAMFQENSEFKDSDALAKQCAEKAEVCRKDAIYSSARTEQIKNSIAGCESAIKLFESISGWKDADEQTTACQRKIEEIKAKEEADRLERERQAEQRRKKRKKIAAIVTPIVVACIAFIIVLTTVIIPNGKYNSALDLYNAGKYDEAITAFTALGDYKDSQAQLEKCYIGKYGEEKYNLIKVGDTYKFGSYEQDNKTSNGKEEIEWIVLDKDGMSLLLISKYALDCQQYNTSYTDVTWETCSLRKWLNGTFLSAAFSSEEQNCIISSTVTADKNPSYSTSPGNNTTDKVFLLSNTEVNKYFSSDSARQCSATTYAKVQGAYTTTSNGNCWWWLRSPGLDSFLVAFVNYGGSVDLSGDGVGSSDGAVRPALWISLD